MSSTDENFEAGAELPSTDPDGSASTQFSDFSTALPTDEELAKFQRAAAAEKMQQTLILQRKQFELDLRRIQLESKKMQHEQDLLDASMKGQTSPEHQPATPLVRRSEMGPDDFLRSTTKSTTSPEFNAQNRAAGLSPSDHPSRRITEGEAHEDDRRVWTRVTNLRFHTCSATRAMIRRSIIKLSKTKSSTR